MNTAARRTQWMEPGEETVRLRESQQGSAEAFGRIVRSYQRAVYRVAYALTRNAGDADDVTQDTFLRAWQAIGRFRVGEPLYPWLARIAMNTAFSLMRRRKRRPEVALEPMLETGAQWATGDDPAADAAAGERDQRLAKAYDALSEEHRAVLALRVVEDLSYDEIARTLKVPVGTVMSRLSRARDELRSKMQTLTGENP
jgi:RNA polymerase sigma-70 factor (ECF subfamily)